MFENTKQTPLPLQVELDSICTDRYEPFKVLILGDYNVGKTCLARLYLKEQVVKDSAVTIGFDYHDKNVQLEDGISVNVSLSLAYHSGNVETE